MDCLNHSTKTKNVTCLCMGMAVSAAQRCLLLTAFKRNIFWLQMFAQLVHGAMRLCVKLL